jgi:hypothetical protein
MIRNLITPAEYRKEKAMQRMAKELDVPLVQAFYQVEVWDKHGNPLDGIRSRSHSWVRNAYNMMFSQLAAKNADDNTFEAGKLSIKDTDGTVRYGEYSISHLPNQSLDSVGGYGYRAGAGIDTYGIVVGSGDTAESIEGYALITKIANGTAAGQLSYIAQDECVVSWSSPTLKGTWVRYFNNNSGGSIDVKEIGKYLYAYVVNTAQKWMMSRDLLGATVTVPNSGQLKVTYEITLTYP